MSEVPNDETLTDLFRAAGEAHEKAFAETKGLDPEWPLWYAEYLHSPLSQKLNTNFTRSELIYLLFLADKEHRQHAPEDDWASYYARFFEMNYT
jgi:hypothetical protein